MLPCRKLTFATSCIWIPVPGFTVEVIDLFQSELRLSAEMHRYHIAQIDEQVWKFVDGIVQNEVPGPGTGSEPAYRNSGVDGA